MSIGVRAATVAGFLAIIFLAGNAHAELSAAEKELDAIMAEHWEFSLREDPTMATAVGVNDYNDRMPSVIRGDQLRRMEAEKSFLR